MYHTLDTKNYSGRVGIYTFETSLKCCRSHENPLYYWVGK